MEITVTNKVESLAVENYTSANAGMTNEHDYQQANLFVRVEHIHDVDTPQRDARLSLEIILRPPFRMYTFVYFRGPVSAISKYVVDGKYMTTGIDEERSNVCLQTKRMRRYIYIVELVKRS